MPKQVVSIDINFQIEENENVESIAESNFKTSQKLRATKVIRTTGSFYQKPYTT